MGARATTVAVPARAPRLRDIADLPKPGTLFKDITPLLAHGEDFRGAISAMAHRWRGQQPDAILPIEPRRVLLGAAMARALGVGGGAGRKTRKPPRKGRGE